MKFLIICTILAAAAAQTFVGQPAQLILQRNPNRAVLHINEGSFGNQLQQEFSGSERFGKLQQGVSGSQKQFNSPQQSFSSDSRSSTQTSFGPSQGIGSSSQGLGLGGSSPDFTATQGVSGSSKGSSLSSESFSNQANQGFGNSKTIPISLRVSSHSNQQSPSNAQQGPVGTIQLNSGIFEQGPVSSQQSLSSSRIVQHSSDSQQQQSNRNQSVGKFQQSNRPSQGNSFQGSNTPQFKSSNQQQSLLQSASSQIQEEAGGVFEPFNLPSGATLLLGDINTSFNCVNQPYGYYADQQNSCRVFHTCYPALFANGRVETYQYSFMCGEGTRFDQKEMTCVNESNAIPCNTSPEFYYRNTEFGLPEEHANL